MEPIFFKYIVPLACKERLRVPPAHHWNKEREFPETIILTTTYKNRNNNKWAVKLENVDNSVCFVDGWLDFVKHNNVQVGDFVVFENVGPCLYSVLLLDPNTACEKQAAFEETEESSVIVKEEEEEEEDITEEEEEEEDDDDEDEEDDDFDLEEESIELRRGNSNQKNGNHMARKRRTISPHASNRSTDIYGNAIFKSRGIPLPTNPYFVTRRRIDRNDELFVPLNVIKDYNLDLPKKTSMLDIDGTEWATELNIWKDGRCWYYGGWSSFCRKNHVEVGDACICEFVQEEPGNSLILLVYKL